MKIELSRKEKIILLLLKYSALRDDYIQPYAVSQKGISRALGMNQSNVSRELSALKAEKFIEVFLSHFKNAKRKMNAYHLTEEGRGFAEEIVSKVRSARVSVRLQGTEKISDVEHLITLLGSRGIRPSLFSLVDCLEKEERPLSLRRAAKRLSGEAEGPGSVPRERETEYSHQIVGMVGRGPFIGRASLLEELLEDLRVREFVCVEVLGLAGMGKSALAREVIGRTKEDRNVLYFRFHRLRRFSSFAEHLTSFLGADDGADMFSSLCNFCEDSSFLLVLDDAHKANDGVRGFLEGLFLYSKKLSRMKVLVLGRERVEEKSYEALKHGGRWVEKLLPPLEPDECAELLSLNVFGKKGEVDREVGEGVRRATGGIPLLLEVMGERDILFGKIPVRNVSVLGNEVFRRLGDESERMMKALSLCSMPVEKEIAEGGGELFPELSKLLLVERTEEGLYEVHDHLKDLIARDLGYGERKDLVASLILPYFRNIFERKDKGEYLPDAIAEDLGIYLLEYVHHLLKADDEVGALTALKGSPVRITRPPYCHVVSEFLDRIEVKGDGGRPAVALLRAEIALEQGRIKAAREHYEMAKLGELGELGETAGGRGVGRGDKRKGRGAGTTSSAELERVGRMLEEREGISGITSVERALRSASEAGDRLDLLLDLANLCQRRGLEGATGYIEEATTLLDEIPAEECPGRCLRIAGARYRARDILGAEKVAGRGLRSGTGTPSGTRGALFKLLGQTSSARGDHAEAVDRYGEAEACFRRSKNPYQMCDAILRGVRSSLAGAGILKSVTSVDFHSDPLPEGDPAVIGNCMDRIGKGCGILRAGAKRSTRLSRLLGGTIFDDRNTTLLRQFLLLKCSMEYITGEEEGARATSRAIIALGRHRKRTDYHVEGVLIRARLLDRKGRTAEAESMLEEWIAKKDVLPSSAVGSLKATLRLVGGKG